MPGITESWTAESFIQSLSISEAAVPWGIARCFFLQLSDPVAVRYGWADNPPCNLSNRAGLPASPGAHLR